MDVIPEAVVEETWREVAQLSPSRAQKEMTNLGKAQPHLLEFVLAFTQDLSQEAMELGLYILLVVWQMFKKGFQGKMREISSKEIGQTFRAVEEAMERLEGVHERFLERIVIQHMSAQPYVMKFVLETLVETVQDEEAVPLTEEDQAYLFLLFRTLIDVLDGATGSTSTRGTKRSRA